MGKRWRKFTLPTGNDPGVDSFTPRSEPAAMMWISFLFSSKYFFYYTLATILAMLLVLTFFFWHRTLIIFQLIILSGGLIKITCSCLFIGLTETEAPQYSAQSIVTKKLLSAIWNNETDSYTANV